MAKPKKPTLPASPPPLSARKPRLRDEAEHLAAHVLVAWAGDLTGGSFEGKGQSPFAVSYPSNKRGRDPHCLIAHEFWRQAQQDRSNALQYAVAALAGDALSMSGKDTELQKWPGQVPALLFPRLHKVPHAPELDFTGGMHRMAGAILKARPKALRALARYIEQEWADGKEWVWDSEATGGFIGLHPG